MKIKDFTYTFLPTLVEAYLRKELPFSALVDLDIWKELFPYDSTSAGVDLPWSQVKLLAKPLDDGTLILIYSLPEPMDTKIAKFVAVRIDRDSIDSYNKLSKSEQKSDNCPVRYYALVRPLYHDDIWDIMQFDLSNTKRYNLDNMSWYMKNNGTWSLRAFVNTIENQPMYPEKEMPQTPPSVKTKFKEIMGELFGFHPTNADESGRVLSMTDDLK